MDNITDISNYNWDGVCKFIIENSSQRNNLNIYLTKYLEQMQKDNKDKKKFLKEQVKKNKILSKKLKKVDEEINELKNKKKKNNKKIEEIEIPKKKVFHKKTKSDVLKNKKLVFEGFEKIKNRLNKKHSKNSNYTNNSNLTNSNKTIQLEFDKKMHLDSIRTLFFFKEYDKLLTIGDDRLVKITNTDFNNINLGLNNFHSINYQTNLPKKKGNSNYNSVNNYFNIFHSHNNFIHPSPLNSKKYGIFEIMKNYSVIRNDYFPVFSVTSIDNGKLAVMGNTNGELKIFDINNEQYVYSIKVHDNNIQELNYNNINNLLLSNGVSSLKLWRTISDYSIFSKKNFLKLIIDIPEDVQRFSSSIITNNSIIMSYTNNNKISEFEIENKRIINTINYKENSDVTKLNYWSNHKNLIISTESGKIIFFDSNSNKITQNINLDSGSINNMKFDYKNNYIITCHGNNRINIIDYKTLRLISSIGVGESKYNEGITDISICEKNKFLFAGGSDGSLYGIRYV